VFASGQLVKDTDTRVFQKLQKSFKALSTSQRNTDSQKAP